MSFCLIEKENQKSNFSVKSLFGKLKNILILHCKRNQSIQIQMVNMKQKAK